MTKVVFMDRQDAEQLMNYATDPHMIDLGSAVLFTLEAMGKSIKKTTKAVAPAVMDITK